jgi:predicted metalloprotease with PDZ domain
MNKFSRSTIIIFLCSIVPLHTVFANSYSSIYYTITPLFGNKVPAIKVTAEIRGEIRSQLSVDLPSRWASGEYVEQLKEVKVDNFSYRIISNNELCSQLIITIPKFTDRVIISYEVHQKNGDPAEVHEAIIRTDLVHSVGYGIFAIPSDAEETDKISFNIEWKEMPNKWKTISSYGTAKLLNFTAKAQELLHAIYAAGNLRIYQIADSKNPVFLSLYRSFDVKDNSIVASLQEIVKTQRSFFNDHNFPYYAISLIEGNDPNSMGGTRLYDSFAAYLPKGMNHTDYYILFAHEHLHNWIGGKISNNERSSLDYWWSEGFTDYYARVLALRSGGISLEEFIDECNQILRNYYLSPVINQPNSKIKNSFWKNENVQKLPYARGFVFAVYLNSLIKLYDDTKSVDNIILDLFKIAKQQPFSVKSFKEIAKNYTFQGIEQEISRFIDQGKTINLTTATPILPLETIKMGQYERGFNRDKILKNKIIHNINPNSNAYKAGLRNGDKVVEFSFPKGSDPDQIATIKTINKTFKFRPESDNKKEIYQFKSNLSSEDKLKIKRFFGVEI